MRLDKFLQQQDPATVRAVNVYAVCVIPLKGTTPKASMIIDRLLFQTEEEAFTFLDFVSSILHIEAAVYQSVIEYPVIIPELFIDVSRLRNFSMSFRLLDEQGSTLDMDFKTPANITIAELPVLPKPLQDCRKCTKKRISTDAY